MLHVILSGCLGFMGNVVKEGIDRAEDIEIVCGVDNKGAGSDFPVFSSFKDIEAEADVIIDFSHPSVLDGMLSFAKSRKIPVVIATTGYSDKQIEQIKAAAKEIPVFFTFNMSLGINLLTELAKKAATVLQGFDIEIIEKHHNQKIDAPSGTAIMLANAVNEAKDNALIFEYDRHSHRKKRDKNELGIHSVRGGTIVGEHEIMFCGRDEVVTLSHTALSKNVFATGAISAARFLADKPAGLYDMSNLIKGE